MQVYHLPAVVTALLFDIDNTLYSNDAYASLQVELLIQRFATEKHIGFDEAEKLIDAEKARYAAANAGAKTSIGNIMSHLGVSLQENARWRDELFKPEEHLQPDEATIRAVRLICSRFAVAAVTNNTVGIGRRTLASLGLSGFFAVVIGLDTCFASKPAPEPFQTALRLLDTPPAGAVSVGDRYDVDLEVPLSMGMGGILIEELSDLHALPELLTAHQKK